MKDNSLVNANPHQWKTTDLKFEVHRNTLCMGSLQCLMGYQNTNFKVWVSLFGYEELKLPKQHIEQWHTASIKACFAHWAVSQIEHCFILLISPWISPWRHEYVFLFLRHIAWNCRNCTILRGIKYYLPWKPCVRKVESFIPSAEDKIGLDKGCACLMVGGRHGGRNGGRHQH